ncbi:hypothetical protein JTE90_021022 [Oedothorax gibbosus]|uniref:Uncharacterized protein n=1 Tax=Oedothorax gibbosus TaxID=931172 RepID=A0AAV6TF77_9ARAC|nr:hypothetical protein JTE90_021022 [Oedothorax gibbosus]
MGQIGEKGGAAGPQAKIGTGGPRPTGGPMYGHGGGGRQARRKKKTPPSGRRAGRGGGEVSMAHFREKGKSWPSKFDAPKGAGVGPGGGTGHGGFGRGRKRCPPPIRSGSGAGGGEGVSMEGTIGKQVGGSIRGGGPKKGTTRDSHGGFVRGGATPIQAGGGRGGRERVQNGTTTKGKAGFWGSNRGSQAADQGTVMVGVVRRRAPHPGKGKRGKAGEGNGHIKK